MQTSQKILFGLGGVVIIGLGVFMYRQLTMNTVTAPSTGVANTSLQEKKKPSENVVPKNEVPSTPDTITQDILKEVDADNSMLNEEEQGAVSSVEAQGATVSDFGTIYDANEN